MSKIVTSTRPDGRKKAKARSAISNGTRLLPVDGRTAKARRFRDLFEDICADLGGVDRLSEGQKQLAKRASLISATCEELEAKAAKGDASFDIEIYGVLTDRLGRLFDRIGLERRSRDVTPSLSDYIASRGAAEPAP